MAETRKAWLDGWAAGFLACAYLLTPRGSYSQYAEMRDEMLRKRAELEQERAA